MASSSSPAPSNELGRGALGQDPWHVERRAPDEERMSEGGLRGNDVTRKWWRATGQVGNGWPHRLFRSRPPAPYS